MNACHTHPTLPAWPAGKTHDLIPLGGSGNGLKGSVWAWASNEQQEF